MDAKTKTVQLTAMGYESSIAAIAAQQPGGLEGAIEWLEQHQFAAAKRGPPPAPASDSPPPASAQQTHKHHHGLFSHHHEAPPPQPDNHSPKVPDKLAQDRAFYDSKDRAPPIPTKIAEDRSTQQDSKNGSPPQHHSGTYRSKDEKDDADAPPPYFAPDSDPRGPITSNSNTNANTNPDTRNFSSNLPPRPAYLAEDKEVGAMRSFFKRLGGDQNEMDKHRQHQMEKSEHLMYMRWGSPESPVREMVARYWKATHMANHWGNMLIHHPHEFKHYADKGYCEPIPTRWVQSRELAMQYPEGSTYETPAEERLYYFLNHGVPPDGYKGPHLRPLNFSRDRQAMIRRGNERNARAHPLDPTRLAAYRSERDVFFYDSQIQNFEYSPQVDNILYAARTQALHELADGIHHGTDHLETMLLIDVSSSMTWDPHSGIPGPDGIIRYHDQPPNIQLVQHLVHRVLYHMIARARKEHPQQHGIETVTFSTWGKYIGQLSADNFNKDWNRVQLGGGTQVMQGWQVVKNTYFEHQHKNFGHGRWDSTFGWQPTPGMPKLSLLMFLDGEAQDMDEFELELLGENWAYVTIALVGMEGCPHHHSHAIELERVARFNPHVGFFDVHGRVCERMVVEDLLKSVYPIDPPAYDEITNPEFDLPNEKTPSHGQYGQYGQSRKSGKSGQYGQYGQSGQSGQYGQYGQY